MEGTRRAFCPKCDEVGGDIVKRSASRKRVKTTNLGADEQRALIPAPIILLSKGRRQGYTSF